MNKNLSDLVQQLIASMQERWNQQLSLDLQENIKACLTTLARNCPADPTSQAKRRALIKSTYQLLIQRVKCGFTFDEATISPGAQLHYLVYDSKKSLNTQNKILLKEFNKREREREQKIPPAHSLIIGENYYALQNLLAAGYRCKIDVIYIDPPYNTKELQSYKDKFQRHG